MNDSIYPATHTGGAATALYCLVAVTLLCFCGHVGAETSGDRVRTLIDEQFVRYDPDYRQHRQQYGAQLAALGNRLAQIEAQGRELHCSRQIYLEAKWLHRYTAHWDKLVDKLARLELSLEDDDQQFATRQSPTSGVWGACFEAYFLRIGATVQALETLASRGEKPRYPIRTDGVFDTGKKLLTGLQDLLISDIARTGVDHRGELSSLLTSFSQGLFKQYIRDHADDKVVRLQDVSTESMEEAFRFFLAGAQDPVTGYWGAWYLVDGNVHKTTDLSMTYHIVSYTRGGVGRWLEIINTTFAIEHERYPYGWRHKGRYNNHNLYDVAKILKFGWPHMSEAQRTVAGNHIETGLQWSLSNTIAPDGSFAYDSSFSDSLADEFYFGVSFLDVVGYWRPKRRFWARGREFDDNETLCCRIKARLEALSLEGWAAEGAREKLARNCGVC